MLFLLYRLYNIKYDNHNDQQVKNWKEAVMDNLNVVSKHLQCQTKKNHETQTQWSAITK